MSKFLICDAQVHAPARPGFPERPTESTPPGTCSIGRETLSREMAEAGVSRAVLVPYPGGHNEECVQWALEEPSKYTVMGTYVLSEAANKRDVATWKIPGMSGMRVSFFTDASRTLLLEDKIDWLWQAAEEADLPLTVNAAKVVAKVGQVAERYPNLRLMIDHMGIMPREKYRDFSEVLAPLLPLARYPNVSVKLTKLPSAVAEPYPFPTLHTPIRQVVEAFGSHRVFWGSDLTTLLCPYSECVRLFTEALTFLGDQELELIMGRAICDWLDWPMEPGATFS